MSLIINHQLDSISTSSGTLSLGSLIGALTLPQGSTAQQPGTPVKGMLRFNTDSNVIEFYNGSIWTSNAGSGGITGPNLTTNNGIATWSGIVGGVLQNTGVTIDSSNNMAGVAQLTAGTINSTGSNLVIKTTTSGNILITPAAGGTILIGSDFWPLTDGTNGQAILTNGVGVLGFQNVLLPANNLSDVVNASTALTNLGGKKYKGTVFLNTNTVMDASFYGKLVIINTPGITITLPALASGVDGQIIKFVSNFASGGYTVQPNGSEKMYWWPNNVNVGAAIVNANDSPEFENYTAGAIWYVSSHQTSSSSAVQGNLRNLKIVNNNGAPNNVMNTTVDEIVLKDSSGNAFGVTAVSVSPNILVNGANGLDTGAVASNNWYYIWVISNGSTTAGLYSLSATAPTMPAGYIYKARVGAIITDASSNFRRILQYNENAVYTLITGSNTGTLPLMASGAQGNGNTPTWVAIPTVGFIPPTATVMKVAIAGWTNNNADACVSPNNNYGVVNSNVSHAQAPLMNMSDGYPNLADNTLFGDVILESSNIYIVGSAGNMWYRCYGWKDSI